MAPYVEREWGEKATELMWRVKQLADPDGVLAPGVVLNRDPGVHLRNLKTTPPIEESADDLRRVRLLRAGLPQPQPDDDAAPADRAAAGDGAPARRLAGAAGAARGVRVRGARDLRRRRLLPARLPGRDRHRQARQGTARARATPSAPKGWRWRRAKRWGTVEGACARRPAPRRPAGARARKRGRALPAAGPRASCRRRSTRAPPPSTSPPAPTASSAPAAADGMATALAWSRRWSRSRRGPGCRSGSRRTSRAAAAGCPGARKGSARRTATRRTRWSSGSGAGAGRGRCRSSSTPPPAPARSPTPATASSPRRTPSASPSSRSSTRSPGPTTACCPGSRSARRSARATVHPTCATRHLGLDPPARSPRRRPRRRRLRAADGDLLRLRRRPRHLPPRADRRRHRAPRRASSPAATSTPTSPATAPARSASSAPPASPTSP